MAMHTALHVFSDNAAGPSLHVAQFAAPRTIEHRSSIRHSDLFSRPPPFEFETFFSSQSIG
jgi:hypothetical protein